MFRRFVIKEKEKKGPGKQPMFKEFLGEKKKRK
jgi:hypothetical protein